VLRLSKLLREIGVERGNKTIIFVETKKKVDDITKAIRREGYVCFLTVFAYEFSRYFQHQVTCIAVKVNVICSRRCPFMVVTAYSSVRLAYLPGNVQKWNWLCMCKVILPVAVGGYETPILREERG
jgi:hypothetical protein